MSIIALFALALAQTSETAAEPVAQPAVRQLVTLKGCTSAVTTACSQDALLIANSEGGVCTDEVLPSGLFTIGKAARHGYLTRAKLVAEGEQQAGTAANSMDQPSEPADTALLVTMDDAGPHRLCVPLVVAVAGQRFRVEVGEDGPKRASTRFGVNILGGLLRRPETKGFRIAEAQPGTEAYLLGPGTSSTANLSAVRALGDYLFGTGASALVSVTILSDRPKPVLLDGIVRGRTNMSFRVALIALDRLMIRDGAQTLPLQRCRAVEAIVDHSSADAAFSSVDRLPL